ncbi:hypothetical protein [Stigmatella aurantiaca]|uniref:Lipoprotein n=1 Tax=Stigmatella aurantiaca (strain DW4/3-1) TaxID=378806 RepID=Q09AG7_STIAD|nr:hypothetical protein [Stigmatella aurantiaca]ADO68014.1 uncharacterized protein STAUR_0205 [Stigmatella aurantiaca DW4/3-1]EAU68750.1 hypothetical protein STIAU_2800 [Stigmatella aurantiaca DW4/3-1]
MFKRMMVLGAVASALALVGCQDRPRQDPAMGGSGLQNENPLPATQTPMPATGGSGTSGSTSTEDTTQSRDIENGADLGTGGAGGQVTPVEPNTGSDVNGTGGSGTMTSPDSFDTQVTQGDLHNNPPSNTTNELGGTGGAGTMNDQTVPETTHPDSKVQHDMAK